MADWPINIREMICASVVDMLNEALDDLGVAGAELDLVTMGIAARLSEDVDNPSDTWLYRGFAQMIEAMRAEGGDDA